MTSTPDPRASDPTNVRRDRGWYPLVAFVAVAQAVGAIGSLFTETGPGSWYDQLDKPTFTPPGWVFAPAWITLYLAIGVAGWLAWRADRGRGRTRALGLWTGQLALNGLWTPVFFGAENPRGGLAVIGALLIIVVATAVALEQVDRRAAWLFLPYLGWLAFATALNIAIVAMN